MRLRLAATAVIVGVALLGAACGSGESASEETTQPSVASTTTTIVTTTTVAPTTTATSTSTTTLPAILAEGGQTGDHIGDLDIPDVPVVIELIYAGSGRFRVWSLGAADVKLNLLVDEIGSYDGTRPMQWSQDETVTALGVSATGDWSYEVRSLLQEPEQSCRVDGSGDSVVLLTDFADAGGAADITHDGDADFAVWAWGADGADLLVDEIGAYEGTVPVSAGLFAWAITANGNWSVDC